MTAAIDWGKLTGPEIAELLHEMNNAITLVCVAPYARRLGADQTQELNRLVLDLMDAERDIRRQLYRIPVAIAKAEATLTWLARRRRGPVPVPGTL